MLCVEVLKNGDCKVECLGGGYVYLRGLNDSPDCLFRFGGSKYWIPTYFFGGVNVITRLTEDYSQSQVKSILVKKLFKTLAVN